ncbi:MAG: HipA N-terminal domain-containing protein [Fibrobacter sp.]|nr:HipA N-terminal domain-containing protein [Fibrobacter sp.]
MNSIYYKIRKAFVFKNGKIAGILLASKRRFVFIYDGDYLDKDGTSIAINLPKSKRIFYSKCLFPFFSGLLPEGENRADICKRLKINVNDDFAVLLALCKNESIGDITLQEIQ